MEFVAMMYGCAGSECYTEDIGCKAIFYQSNMLPFFYSIVFLTKCRYCHKTDGFSSRYLNNVGRTDSVLALLVISRDPTPTLAAEAALAMVDTEVGLDYWLPHVL